MNLSKKMISLSIGGAIGLVFLASIPGVVKNLGSVTERQIAANNRLTEWKAAYQALQPVNEQWERAFTSADAAKDLVGLFRAFRLERHGLYANADSIMQTGAYPVDVQGSPVGLQKLCIGSNPESLELSARNMAELREGIRAVAQRRDIDIGSVAIGVNPTTQRPYAEVKNFCLRVRT